MDQDEYLSALRTIINRWRATVKKDPTDMIAVIQYKAVCEHLDAIDRGEIEPWTEI